MSDAARGPPDARKGAQAPPSWQADCDPCTCAGVHAEHAIQVSWRARSAGTIAITTLHGADCKHPAQHAGPHDGAHGHRGHQSHHGLDDDVIELDLLSNDGNGDLQARSPLPPSTGRIVRSLHAQIARQRHAHRLHGRWGRLRRARASSSHPWPWSAARSGASLQLGAPPTHLTSCTPLPSRVHAAGACLCHT